jgi:hypothetical protein
VILVLGFALVAAALGVAPADPEGLQLFERSIRPALVEHCYECHSARKDPPEGGLRLDSPRGIREGGDTGRAVVPGDAAASLLMAALRHEGPEMPPSGRLPGSVIADFARWIDRGAPVPNQADEGGVAEDHRPAEALWSLSPLRRPALSARPWSFGATPPAGAIDVWVAQSLRDVLGAHLAVAAPRRVLLRRAAMDLLGLPPTLDEVEAFEADTAPDAYERVIDRLLASPHHGERWARHWLDVARYADTKDQVLVLGKDAIRPYAYTYRDYVIRSFNEDTPYDQFIVEQLAADRLRPAVPTWKLAALGFLTLGRLFDDNPPDVYDDQIDTTMRALLGLTVSCARCHDHKYDPITMEDYYALYGVFASCERPVDLPRLDDLPLTPQAMAFEEKLRTHREELRRHVDAQYEEITRTARQRVGDYLVKAGTEPPDPNETAIFFQSLSPDQLRPTMIARWRRFLARRSRPDDPVFGPWHDLLQLADNAFASQAAHVLSKWLDAPQGTSRGQINPIIRLALVGASLPSSRADVARLYGNALLSIDKNNEDPSANGSVRGGFSEESVRQIESILTGPDSPFYFPRNNTYLFMSRVPRDEYHKKLLELDKLAVYDDNAPPRAMLLVDAAETYEPRVFLRGNPTQPGHAVPRRFVAAVSSGTPQAFTEGSGRLELARSIAAPENPLTSRVLVNRLWMHHMGRPLVATPTDFGSRSDPPSHPQLLDWLTCELIDSGWSIKRLHRRIVLSAVYCQSSADRPECRAKDPENGLLWRAHRRRLDLESLRDSLLAVSGRLDRRLLGRPLDVAGDPHCSRRTIYGLVDRQNLPAFYRAFDFASPDQPVGQRPTTTVPQQALFFMNSPFVIEQTHALAADVASIAARDHSAGITALYQRVFQRAPDAEETQSGMEFLDLMGLGEGADKAMVLAGWQQYIQVLLCTNELYFVD